jgi:N-acyl-L-homoserine lactone synthetase
MSAGVKRSTSSVYPRLEKRLSDRLATLLARIDCRRADTAEEREAIFRLRYQAYLREGAISANSSERFADDDDDKADNAYLFGFYIDDQLASSLRLHIGSEQYPHFPSLEVFPDVLQPLLDAHKVIVDSTRFVADEELARRYRGLPYATLRVCMLAAEYFGVDHLLAAVREEHQAFYKRAFDHQLLCEPRPYPRLAKPISLMTVHFPSAAERLYQQYPFFRSSIFERRKLFDRRLPPAARSGHGLHSSHGADANREPADSQESSQSGATNRSPVEFGAV